ncbi:hypothetical protein BVRB_1g018080 [Beta vulgaris subsp. vulgaris]|nr:hypothetical protein BVRB_1g018080 [Beta vulgaris subsp. vulgaris]
MKRAVNVDSIIEITKWAVNEYNKGGHCLKFEKVLKSEVVAVNGMLYKIDLEASNGGLLDKYYAQVYDYLGERTLQEFKPLLQANSLLEVDASIGILKPVLGVDAHVAIPN